MPKACAQLRADGPGNGEGLIVSEYELHDLLKKEQTNGASGCVN